MKLILFFAVLLLLPAGGFAQGLDSIWTTRGVIGAKITASTDRSIHYQLPDETVDISVFKSNIFKIKYATGRVEAFTDALTLEAIHNPWEWQKVTVTANTEQVSGFTALRFLSTSVIGTKYSNTNRLMGKTSDKIKMQTAMLGGNVFCTQSRYSEIGGSLISGAAYTSQPLDFVAFEHFCKSTGPTFKLASIARLKFIRRIIVPVELTQPSVTISNPQIANGIITVNATINGIPNSTFQVAWFDTDLLILSEIDDRGLFSVTLLRQ